MEKRREEKRRGEENKEPTGEFKCDSYGKKQCLDEDPQCAEGEFWNEDACMCFSLLQCKKYCGDGFVLDPREFCSCIPQKVVNKLF